MGFEKDSLRGVYTYYGVRTVDQDWGGEIEDEVIKTAQWTFNYDDLPTYDTSKLTYSIPANARILSAKLEIITAITSTSTTTDLDIGLYTSAGVAIDADGLIKVTDATQTTIGTAGNIIVGTGALINATIGSTAGQVVVTPSANDLTAGKARLIVQYITKGL
jgi:hypothetical protein